MRHILRLGVGEKNKEKEKETKGKKKRMKYDVSKVVVSVEHKNDKQYSTLQREGKAFTSLIFFQNFRVISLN